MMKSARFIILIISLLPFIAIAQKESDFVLDSNTILDNKNLDDFLPSLKKDRFHTHTNKDSIPTFIRLQLDKLTKGFSIANPKEAYQCCCTSSDSLPERQLSFLAKSKNVLAMTYKTGGLGVSTHLLLIRFENTKMIDLWSGYCWAEIKNINDIVSFIQESKKKPQLGHRRPSIQVGMVIL